MRQVAAPSAWDITTGTASVVVGVVDSGVRYTHQDLATNMWSNPGNIGNCGAGSHGFNAVDSSCDPMDYYGHGTMVAGIIGARGNNSTGLVGINWTTSIMALKIGDSPTSERAITAITWAIQAKQQGVNLRVLNCSFGFQDNSHLLMDQINLAGDYGILTVASVGNSTWNLDDGIHYSYPASWNLGTMINVAATGPNSAGDSNDNLAGYSNYGAYTVHMGAPGGGQGNGLLDIVCTNSDSCYFTNVGWGTSLAAPLVSGAAALVAAACPSLSVWQLKYTIVNTGDPDSYLSGKTSSGRRLNVNAAIRSCY